MAEFLTTSGISYQIDNIMMDARKHLVLVSPYLKLSKTFFERIKDASNRNVRVVIVYGKDELKKEEHAQLATLANLELYYFDNLHAKCYFNEGKMVITSMNMYEYSLQNNREMGVFCQKEEDPQMFRKAVDETFSIIQSAERVEIKKGSNRITQRIKEPAGASFRQGNREWKENSSSTKPQYKSKRSHSGFCIRCKDAIAYDPERPYCWDCYFIWSQFENPEYEEKVCHQCGEREVTSMSKPECYGCYTGW